MVLKFKILCSADAIKLKWAGKKFKCKQRKREDVEKMCSIGALGVYTERDSTGLSASVIFNIPNWKCWSAL
jgi:hypothetical protein